MQRCIWGLFKHRLAGKPAWSTYQPVLVDPGKIISMRIHRRSFCFFDKKYPYTLSLQYYDPAIQQVTITRRFHKIIEAQEELDKIRGMQARMNVMVKHMSRYHS